jgi:hypothetical protein
MPAGNLATGGVTIVGTGRVVKQTYNLASGITAANIGHPVKLDTSGNNKVALAGDGDIIFGVLESFEDRIVEGTPLGAVAICGGYRFTYSGTAPTVGAYAIGNATNGIKATATANKCLIVAVDTTNTTVDVLIGY